MNLKLALRRLLKTPFVSLVAIMSLALGIGANAAIFSLYDQTLLRPLPVVRPAELVDFSARTRATVVAPFVLSSPGGSFDQFDFVDRQGNLRPQLFIWGSQGP